MALFYLAALGRNGKTQQFKPHRYVSYADKEII